MINCVLVFRWLPFVINLFANAENFKPAVRADKLNNFYNSVSTLISNQVAFCLFARDINFCMLHITAKSEFHHYVIYKAKICAN